MPTFQELGLSPAILQSLEALGFEQPMPIQAEIIPQVLGGRQDIVGLAQTGTGKTAAFGLPIVHQVDPDDIHVRALVLCPTRELAIQIEKDLTSFAKKSGHIRSVAVYGGANIDTQIRALKKHPQIVVATPGRILDLIRRKKVDLSQVDTLVLDEADEMLNFGFREELEAVLKETPTDKRVLLFSATFSKDISRIARTYMSNPLEVSVGKKNSGSDNVSFVYYMTKAKEKYSVLKRIVDISPDIYGIVFCRTRNETKDIAEKLIRDGYSADALHGELSQSQRDYIMKRFRSKSLQLLVATDVAARGLDVNDLTHVINYNLPDETEVYTHRSGRTGRAGKKGTCIALVNHREKRKLARVEQAVGKKFEQKLIPTGFEICEKQLFSFINRLTKAEVNEVQIGDFLPKVLKQLEWMDKEQLVKHIVSLEFNRFLDSYKNAPDLNDGAGFADKSGKQSKQGKQAKADKTGRSKAAQTGAVTGRGAGAPKFTRLFLNAGKKQNISPPKLMSLINKATGRKDISFGDIEVKNKGTLFEVEQDSALEVMELLTGRTFGGNTLEVAPDMNPDSSRRKKVGSKAGTKKRTVGKKQTGGKKASVGGKKAPVSGKKKKDKKQKPARTKK